MFEKASHFETELKEFGDEKVGTAKEDVQRKNFVLYCNEFKKHISFVFERIEFIENCFKSYSKELLPLNILQELETDFLTFLPRIDCSVFEENSGAYKGASDIYYLVSDFADIYNQFFRNYFHEIQKEIHFLADAAKGKTHISCNIAYQNIITSKPAIFITGDKFTDETSITDAIRKILDINQEFTFDEFIQALDVYGSIVKAKIPIIIDGLNETTNARFFSPIWQNHLSGFISKINNAENLVVITTCRTSYAKRIWNNTVGNKFHRFRGFADNETIREAVNKYFKKYKLKANLFFAPLEKFRDPIFLKIFCEIKNPNWVTGHHIDVNIEEESAFDVFDEYLKQVNTRITRNSHLLRENESFILESLAILSGYLWENNLREIPIKDFYVLIDGHKNYEKDKSKADILIHEGLVVTRDMRGEKEYLSFTYDLLAGYMISKSLIQKNENLKYFISKEFIEKIIQQEAQHPLYEDVISSLCLLLPQIKQVSIHELIEGDKIFNFTRSKTFKYLPEFIKNKFSKRISYANYAFDRSIKLLFTLPPKYLKAGDVNLVANLFNASHKNKKAFFDLSFKTLSDIKHPLNALFISKLLQSMEMNQRDISWTEYIRENARDIENFISEFETQCKNVEEESISIIQKQHILSKIILWVLTSTHRAMRDEATRALYYYGRKFPAEFSLLVYDSLKINDPYVWERTLASLYGVVMAEHNSLKSDVFKRDYLPEIGKKIYTLIFKENAPHSTTHMLARDYARRIIEISLLHHPNLLAQNEIKNIRPPYSFGGIRDLGEFDYGEKEYGYSGPMRMDFSNYTLGYLVKDGGSYSNPPEKKKLRRQIYWRIYNLGWDAELFKDAESALSKGSQYTGRTERAKTERYGKKYSWIAYFENAGLRDDSDQIEKKYDKFRISGADIDPSFPIKPDSEIFITDDLLGDRNTSLVDWYENGGLSSIEKYLLVDNLKSNNGEWVCLDGFVAQEDISAGRHRFIFIRSLLIKNEDYHEVIKHLNTQDLSNRRIPSKKENYYTYAGELFYCPEATYDNDASIEFTISETTTMVKAKRGLLQREIIELINKGFKKLEEFPEEIERKVVETKEFDVLIPAMEYNWEPHHSFLNDVESTTVVAKEIANYLKLIDQPQTFDLFDVNGAKASIHVNYRNNYNNNHELVYLRKDLLNKFLAENNFKLVWAIWGERDVAFKVKEERHDFFTSHPFTDFQRFQKVVEYTV